MYVVHLGRVSDARLLHGGLHLRLTLLLELLLLGGVALADLGDGEPPLWTNAAMEDLIVEDGRVVGARVKRDGSTLSIEA